MNPLVAQQLKEIAGSIEQIKVAVEHAQSRYEFLEKSKDELQRKSWSQSKELNILREHVASLGDIKRESEQLHELKTDFEKRLGDILKCTRALTFEFKP